MRYMLVLSLHHVGTNVYKVLYASYLLFLSDRIKLYVELIMLH